MAKKRLPKYFYCDIFGASVYFFVGWKEKDFLSYLKRNYNVDADVSDSNGQMKQIIHKRLPIIMVWVRSGKNLRSSLVHESVHATNLILYNAGVRASFVNDELQAYYIQRLYNFGISNR